MKHNWEYKRLGELCDIKRGGSPRPIQKYITDSPDGINWIKIGDAGNSKYITACKEKIIPEGVSKSRFVHKGDFLLSNSMSFGRPYILSVDGCIHDGWLVLEKPKQFITDFLYYVLGSPTIYSEFLRLARGAVVSNLNVDLVSHVKVPVPSLKEQERIVAELDEINELIATRKEQLKELDNLAQSLFYDTFGDLITNPKGWEVKKLSEVCVKITDGTHVSPKFIESGIPFIFVSNIINNEITYVSKKFISEKTYMELWKSTPIEKGDIVYTSVGSYGNPAIVRDDRKFMFQRHIALLKPNSKILDSQFLKSFLMSESGKSQADKLTIGVAQKTLNLKAIKSYSIILPPLSLQQQFAAQVEAIEAQKGVLNESLKELQTLLDSRMDYWFN